MWKKILIAIAIILLIAIAGFVIWAETPLGPMPEAEAALQSDAAVTVETDPWYTFMPTGAVKDTGFIIYPGGRVDPRSYAPTARAIAEAGYPVVLVPMPLNLAVFGAGKAADVIAAYPEVTRWAIGGHSLGGAMAANFVAKNPEAVDGLVFWAAYPASSDNLAGFAALAVSSISATNDGLATPDKIDASRPLLPASTTWLPIQGGNHAQFGWYGPQPGDGQPTISREEQQAQTVAATVAVLEQIEP
jgi:pimeloyl-ACP methyl ester carboxylesterase